ncbi:hypothetical protein [Micromonospora inositola]|uniref:Uncharacterized protein n=1 Tax=Micromonospora inositola TaxID=47865 RepID=A0A1C5IS70_9ACTN|nr:hypothetical protein [Micromonospora inositola]SCG60983.1 hypothetical protein GA0070613_3330 [Micromonospora inositola]
MAGGLGRWLRKQLGAGGPVPAGRSGDRYAVRGDTPAAEALRAWLAARAQLEAAFEPLERRMDAGVDRAALTALRQRETLAWNEFRTRRLEGER